MKKTMLVLFISAILLSTNVYALHTTLPDKRDNISDEAREMKSLLGKSKDVVLINSMWDSCLLTITQLDAYFVMVGIVNTADEGKLSAASVRYLTSWLDVIKKTNDVNLKSINGVAVTMDPETKTHLAKLKEYYIDLNKAIDNDLISISALKNAFSKPAEIKNPVSIAPTKELTKNGK